MVTSKTSNSGVQLGVAAWILIAETLALLFLFVVRLLNPAFAAIPTEGTLGPELFCVLAIGNAGIIFAFTQQDNQASKLPLPEVKQAEWRARDMELALDAVIEAWSKALEQRDAETEGHSERVTKMALQIGEVMGVRAAERVHLWRGAMLHDIGKIAVPDAILRKPGALTKQERAIIEEHPREASIMLSHIKVLRPALTVPLYHHEQWDGSGYPEGRKGEDIPLAARIFAVADVWDALTQDRPYRKAWSETDARHYIIKQSGVMFDPAVVLAFQKVLDGE